MDQFPTANSDQDWYSNEFDPLTKTPEESGKPCDTILQRCCPDAEDSNLVGQITLDWTFVQTSAPRMTEGTFHKLRNASKPHSTPLTLKWLEENYEIAEGVCIPRSTLYYHYLDYCEKNDTQPVNAASFGKIIRQQFPQITTRRLGTRGQSKYHYYGIGVKETSIYYEVMYSAKGVQSSGEGKKENAKQIVAYSPRSKLGTLLPDFPEVKDIKLPANVPEDKVTTFMMMYRTHCQRILDTVIRANFDEVQSFLLHFWQGMPQHMVPILDSDTIVMLVGVCDSILYKAIANVLMPTVLQALPDSLTQVIRRFARQLDEWLKVALDSLPEGLQRIKFDLARRFAQVLRRQTSLNHLCQAARTVAHSPDITSQMLDDWLNIDLNSIVKQTLYTMDDYKDKDHEVIVNLSSEFEHLLEEQAPLESYVDWLERMVDKCVVKPSDKKPGSLRRIARQFLLMWSCFGTRVIRDMTLHSAPSFGSFHLMHLMFDDYVLYLVESLHSQERANDYLRYIKGENDADMSDDIILPDSSVIKEAFIAAVGEEEYHNGAQNERNSVITRTRDNTDTHLPQPSIVQHEVLSSQASGIPNDHRCPEELINQSLPYTAPLHLDTRQASSAFVPAINQNCSSSISQVNQAPPHMSGAEPFIFQGSSNRNQNQFTFPSLYVTANNASDQMSSVSIPEVARYGGSHIVDWNSGFPSDFHPFSRICGDTNIYHQLPGLRQTFDFNSMGYFDSTPSIRGNIPHGAETPYTQINPELHLTSGAQSEKRQRTA